jgi:hypothetical protein
MICGVFRCSWSNTWKRMGSVHFRLTNQLLMFSPVLDVAKHGWVIRLETNDFLVNLCFFFVAAYIHTYIHHSHTLKFTWTYRTKPTQSYYRSLRLMLGTK